MPIVIGVDLGTTKITSIAVDTQTGVLVAIGSAANDGRVTATADAARGHSEWDAKQIIAASCRCLAQVAEQLGNHVGEVIGIGVTGQQHGMLLVDSHLNPVSPLINWQDRRALEMCPEGDKTWLQSAREAIGNEAWKRTGCWLQPGFMAVTLYELAKRRIVPEGARALFIMDYFTAVLTGADPVTEPSCAGSSGVFHAPTRNWDDQAIKALGLSRDWFPPILEADQQAGTLTDEYANKTGLPAGIPIFAPIGDHQASFLGSVADPTKTVLVNVGTGAQVAMFTEGLDFVPPIELRPFPVKGNLLSNVGLAGGWSYQVLEQFFGDVGKQLFHVPSTEKLYNVMNELATAIPSGADGLRCEPRFSGTRLDPTVRGSITGLSPQNFTAGHLCRAILEGMGRSLHEGFLAIQQINRAKPTILVAAGNGLRENPLLAEIVSRAFDLPMLFTRHREEAAFGAALVACVGTGQFDSLEAAANRLIVTSPDPKFSVC
ncbi:MULTISPECIES: sedoheptulokinase [unclassified Schlesneria]|uniref:sedoheptulokinase n=1 Tax=Schlesneria TaxID=656899 RepID=UPI00359F639F